MFCSPCPGVDINVTGPVRNTSKTILKKTIKLS